MISQTSLRYIGTCMLILGLSLAGVALVQSAEPAAPRSMIAPGVYCPPCVPEKPEPSRTAEEEAQHMKEVKERTEKNLRERQKDFEANPPRVLPLPTGILAAGELGMPYPKDNRYENGWAGTANGKPVIVYAGSKGYDASTTVAYDLRTVRGFVIIEKGQWGQPGFYRNVIETPTAVGTLRVIAAKGNVLTLESRQGNKFSLNVETEQLTPLDSK